MKAIYKFNDNKVFTGSDTVDDNYQVGTNETEVQPTDGLYEPITWDGAKWVGTEQAVWQAVQDESYQKYLKEHPEATPQPTADQQMMMAQAADLAALKTIKEAE